MMRKPDVNNPWIKLLICYFVGIFGVHKFLEKKFGMGVLYIFTCGLFGIGWFFDVLKYLIVASKSIGNKQTVAASAYNDSSPTICTSTNIYPLGLKNILTWVLIGLFVFLSSIFLISGNILSWLFALLFMALMLPSQPWQTLVKKYIKGKLKSIMAGVLAVLCLVTVHPAETLDMEPPNVPIIQAGDIQEECGVVDTLPEACPVLKATVETSVEEGVYQTVPATKPTPASMTEPITETPAEPATETPTESSNVPPIELTLSNDSTFSIHFIDVGQADAALVECDGHYMLIDGGNKSDSNVIFSVLKKAKVPKLDIMVGTHSHEDHIGGLPGAFNYTTADLTLCSVTNYDSDAFNDFKKYADEKGGGIKIPAIGDTYSLGSAQVEILGVSGGGDANNTSIVLRIDYGKTSFLFTGDAEREAEQAILSADANLNATVLKVGHHGSDTSTTYPFLREIMPQYAVISVGDGNSYGHPTDDTLSRLRDADVQVFRTDIQGDVFCVSDGKTVTMTVDRNADADVFSGIMETKPPATESKKESPTEEEETAVEDEGWDYVVNKNTKKFHEIYCRYVDDIKKNNRWDFHGDRKTLIKKGYAPCKVCAP